MSSVRCSPHVRRRRGLAVAALLAVSVLTGACSSEDGGLVQQPTTTLGPFETAPLCTEYPEQAAPQDVTADQITSFSIRIWPEGVNASIGDQTNPPMSPELEAAFVRAKGMMPNRLPDPLPQSCCPGGSSFHITYANGTIATYGPCEIPEPLVQIMDMLYRAAV